MKAHQFFFILSAIYGATLVTPLVAACLGGVCAVVGIVASLAEDNP